MSSIEERTYTFDWRPDEHARVTALLLREQFSRGPQRVIKWVLFGILAVAAAVTLLAVAVGDVPHTLALAILTIATAALVLGFPRLVGWTQAWMVRRGDPDVATPITHRFTPDGLSIAMRTIDADLKWSGVPRVRETPDLFLIYYNARTAYFLPKRALGSPAVAADLAEWIRARLPAGTAYVTDA